jgi:hypothetical protein
MKLMFSSLKKLPEGVGVIEKVPYLRPTFNRIKLLFDAKEIVQSALPGGAAKVIVTWLIKNFTRPKLYLRGKYLMLIGGLLMTTCQNPLVVGATVNAELSIINNIYIFIIKQ